MANGEILCKGTSTTTVFIRKTYKEITKDIVVNKKAVKKSILEWLNQLKATLSDTSTKESLQKDIERLEAQRAKLLEAYLEGLTSKEDYKDKYTNLDLQLKEKSELLKPLEENEDVKEIEETIKNIDKEIDEYVSTLEFEENKVDFLIEHTKKITALENKDLIIELDLVAGAIIAGKDFLLYVHDTMPFANGGICYERFS